MKNKHQKKSSGLLIADDELSILTSYKIFSVGKDEEIATATDGKMQASAREQQKIWMVILIQ